MTMENVKTMLLNERTRIKCKHRGRLNIIEFSVDEEVLLIDDDDELDSISNVATAIFI